MMETASLWGVLTTSLADADSLALLPGLRGGAAGSSGPAERGRRRAPPPASPGPAGRWRADHRRHPRLRRTLRLRAGKTRRSNCCTGPRDLSGTTLPPVARRWEGVYCAVHRRCRVRAGRAQPRGVDGDRSRRAGHDLLARHRGRHPCRRPGCVDVIGPFALVVLDMAGTTVRDDGAVDEAFTVGAVLGAASAADDPRFASAQVYVHDTMGQSKADVFAALLEPGDAVRATRGVRPGLRADRGRGPGLAHGGRRRDVRHAARARGEGLPDDRVRAEHPRCVDRGTRLGAAVDLALSPADCGRGRPAPDMILGAMARLGVADPGAVAVVGDTTSDLEAGTKPAPAPSSACSVAPTTARPSPRRPTPISSTT